MNAGGRPRHRMIAAAPIQSVPDLRDAGLRRARPPTHARHDANPMTPLPHTPAGRTTSQNAKRPSTTRCASSGRTTSPGARRSSASARTCPTAATRARLLANQDDIGNAIKPYHGRASGGAHTLLRSHIMGVVALLQAAKSGDDAAVDRAAKAWYRN